MTPSGGDLAPDGSPVEVFRLLPPGPGPGYVAAAVGPRAAVLELGCGAGRMTREMSSLGLQVTAVDESEAMLAKVGCGSVVRADAACLDLRRRFDAVLLASYLVNDPSRGPHFLATARRHVDARGVVVVQRYDPEWVAAGEGGAATMGPVTISVGSLGSLGDGLFSATVEYAVGSRRWAQPVRARVLDDVAFEALAAGAGLRLVRWLDEFRTWGLLTVAGH